MRKVNWRNGGRSLGSYMGNSNVKMVELSGFKGIVWGCRVGVYLSDNPKIVKWGQRRKDLRG